MKHATILILSGILLAFTMVPVLAQDDPGNDDKVYGWQLMTEQERQTYRIDMRTLKTQAERQSFRQAHHQKMQARAAAQGVTLAAPRVRPGQSPGKGNPVKGNRRGKGRQQPTFALFDSDGDGYISANEYRQAHTERIEQRAQEGRRLQGLNAQQFSDIDTDGDGRASREEFAAHQANRRADKAR